jgi:uncharacterized protein DUF2750
VSYKLDPKQLEKILNKSCEERYDYFLNKVADWGEVWILVNDNQEFLKLFSEEDKSEYVPVWPHADFARAYASDSDEPLKAKKISLQVFFERWVPGLEDDGFSVSVFPNLEQTVWIMEPEDLQLDIEEALSR